MCLRVSCPDKSVANFLSVFVLASLENKLSWKRARVYMVVIINCAVLFYFFILHIFLLFYSGVIIVFDSGDSGDSGDLKYGGAPVSDYKMR